jgi:predicted phage terminase large subunit-like protein
LELLDRELVGAAKGKLHADGYTGLIVMVPPRHGKTTLISECFPPWFLGRNPTLQVLLTSHEADFAAERGRRARDILKEHGQRIFGVTVREDSAAADRWEIAGHGGGMATSGVGGPLTGKGAHCLIIDDPIKNWEQAQSSLFREKQSEWYASTARTRLEPGGFIVLVMTRWHEDDLAGRLIRQMEADPLADRFKIIRLPAIAEENDLLDRKPGEPLWPQRYDSEALEKIRRSVGSAVWNSLYLQAPGSTEGAMFQRAWLRLVDTTPAVMRAVRFWDIAATEAAQGTEPDWTVGAKLGVDQFGRVTILNVQRMRGAPKQVEEMVRQTTIADGVSVVVRIEQEPGSAGKIVVDNYRRLLHGYDVRGIPSTSNKVLRAKPLADLAESGRLSMVRAPWNAALLVEFEAFPNGLHDDQVDACAAAFKELDAIAITSPVSVTETDGFRIESLSHDKELLLFRAWYLNGPTMWCVSFQVDGRRGDQINILWEARSDTGQWGSFFALVGAQTNKLYPAPFKREIVIVPSFSTPTDVQMMMGSLHAQNHHSATVQWEPERHYPLFGEKLKAGAIVVDTRCEATQHVIRSGFCSNRNGAVAVDSFWEPLVRAVVGGIAAAFMTASSPLNTADRVHRRPLWNPKGPWRR